MATYGSTRGHALKLHKQRPRLDIRKNYFSVRATDNWKSLPGNIIHAEKIDTFKAKLDRFWKKKLYEQDE